MADELGISPSTLSRELKRGQVKQLDHDLQPYFRYTASVAQADYDLKASRRDSCLKIGHDHELASHLEGHLLGVTADGKRIRLYLPDAVIMELDQQGWPTATRICTRTLYLSTVKDAFFGVTQKDLPRGGTCRRRQRRVRRTHVVSTGRQIEDRPDAADARTEVDHWEMDCIESVKGDRSCLLTFVDRCTREAWLFKLGRQTQQAVNRALNGLERRLGTKVFQERFKSITIDNGSEFWDWKRLEQSVLTPQSRTMVYYAHPYCSWEWGSNENLNGYIRY